MSIEKRNIQAVINTSTVRRIDLLKKSFSSIRLAISTLSNDVWESPIPLENKIRFLIDLQAQKQYYNQLEENILGMVATSDKSSKDIIESLGTGESEKS